MTITNNLYAKNFLVSLPRPNANLESTKVNSVSDYIMLNQLTRGLVNYNTSGELVGDIADSWHITDDNKKFVFKIKPNEKFSNDEKITAKHICDSIGRSIKAEKIVHYDLSNILSCKVVSDDTIEIFLKNSDMYFIKALEHPEFRILYSDDIKAETGKQKFEITSGAYRKNNENIFLRNNKILTNFNMSPESLTFVDSQTVFSDTATFSKTNVDIAWTPTDLSKSFIKFAVENNYEVKIPRLSFSFWININPDTVTDINERKFLQKILQSKYFNFENFDHRLKPSSEIYLSDGPGRLLQNELEIIYKKINRAKFVKISKIIKILLDKNYPFAKDIEKIMMKNKINYKIEFYKNFSEYAELIKNKNNYDLIQVNNDFSSLDLTGPIKVSFNQDRPLILRKESDKKTSLLLGQINKGENKNQNIANLEAHLLNEGLVIPSHYLDILILFNKKKINLDDWLKSVPEIAIWKSKVIQN